MKNASGLDNRALYEQEHHWQRKYDSWFYLKKRLLQAMVEPDVETILDIGCGDGEITNDFCPGRTVVGCDRSRTALAHVTAEKVLANCDNLPFKEKSFDFVLCSEVIEHLPEPVFGKTLKELARVSSKYVVVSVPYREVVAQRVTRCASCGTRYNIDGHLRSFRGPGELAARFSGFELALVKYCGESDPRPWPPLLRLRRVLLRDWPECELAICPKCGSKAIAQNRRPNARLKWFINGLNWRLASRPMHRWMVVKLVRERA